MSPEIVKLFAVITIFVAGVVAFAATFLTGIDADRPYLTLLACLTICVVFAGLIGVASGVG